MRLGGGEEPGNEDRGRRKTCSLKRSNLEDSLGEDCWPQLCWVGGLRKEKIVPLSPGSLRGSISSTVTLRHAPCLHQTEGEETLLIHTHTKYCKVGEAA